jgi:DnaK suppressor protein
MLTVLMDQTTLERFRNQLEALEAELRDSVEGKADAIAPVQVDSSIGRLSRMDAIQSQQMALGLKARQQQALLRVQNALKAIANGTYGECRRCKGPIAIERLEAQPDAVVCVKCAELEQR